MNEVITRIVVTSLTEALPVYRKLSGGVEPRYVELPQFRAAIVGHFMLLEGTRETLQQYQAIPVLAVTDLTSTVQTFTQHGGEVLDGPANVAGGSRTIVRDADGNTFECFQAA